MDWKWMGCQFHADVNVEIEGNLGKVDCFSILPPRDGTKDPG